MLIVDGATIDGNMIPAINGTGHDVTVEVTMGQRYQTGLYTASNMTRNTKMPPQSKLYGGIQTAGDVLPMSLFLL